MSTGCNPMMRFYLRAGYLCLRAICQFANHSAIYGVRRDLWPKWTGIMREINVKLGNRCLHDHFYVCFTIYQKGIELRFFNDLSKSCFCMCRNARKEVRDTDIVAKISGWIKNCKRHNDNQESGTFSLIFDLFLKFRVNIFLRFSWFFSQQKWGKRRKNTSMTRYASANGLHFLIV